MNILFVYSRDIDVDDSGGARTLILLMKYLTTKPDVKAYALFNISGDTVPGLKIIPREGEFKEQLRETIKEYAIDIVMAPEALLLGKTVYEASNGLNCHIVNALHSKPGYEKQNLYMILLESMFFNTSWLKRLRAMLCLAAYPVFYTLYVRKIKNKFKEAYENTDYLVLLSKRFFPEFVEEYHIGDGGKKLRAVGNGLSFVGYATDLDLKNKKKQIVVVSRFEERAKRLSRVFKIWRDIQDQLPDWELVIVGFGRSEPYYRYLLKKYHLKNVRMTGKQSPKSYYMDASIFLMTSDYEGWGMTITEAQQCGCVPVVLNTFSSVFDLIDNGESGFVVDNVKEMEQRILELTSSPSLRNELAVKAIEASKRFEPEKVYEGYYEIFKEITEKN